MLTRDQKKETVAELSEKLARAAGVFVSDYRGLTVGEVQDLRGQLRDAGEGETDYRVAKNSLLRLACEGSSSEVLKGHFVGPTSVTISYGDPASIAKILVKYAKQHEVFEIKGAVLDGVTMDQAEVAKLATLPSLLELRSRIVGLIMAPAGKLARLLNEPGGQLARLVSARKDAIEEE